MPTRRVISFDDSNVSPTLLESVTPPGPRPVAFRLKMAAVSMYPFVGLLGYVAVFAPVEPAVPAAD